MGHVVFKLMLSQKLRKLLLLTLEISMKFYTQKITISFVNSFIKSKTL